MLCRRRKKNYIEAAPGFRNCLSGPLSCLVVLLFILDSYLDSYPYPYPYRWSQSTIIVVDCDPWFEEQLLGGSLADMLQVRVGPRFVRFRCDFRMETTGDPDDPDFFYFLLFISGS